MHIITNEIVSIKQLFLHVTFLSSIEVSVLFKISSSHSNTSLPIRYFLDEKFLISKCSSILHALLYLQSHVLVFHL